MPSSQIAVADLRSTASPLRDPFKDLRRLTDDLKIRTKGGQFGRKESEEDTKTPMLLKNAVELATCLKRVRVDPDAKRRMSENSNAGFSHQLEYFKACTWTAEVLEYFGKTAEAREIVENEGRLVYGSLLDMASPSAAQRRLARQKVWLVLHYCYCCLYRQHEYHKALRVIETCYKVVETRLKDDAFPCYYTRARLWSCRAAVHVQLWQLDEAQRCYETAVHFIYKRLELEKKKKPHDLKRIAQEETRANYEVAKCLALGIGWTQLTRGLLQDARVNVLTALVMLSPINDVLRKAYVQLLLASIERTEAGFDVERLDHAIEIVKQPHRIFTEYNHARYKSRADYELSLAYLYRGKAEEERSSHSAATRYYSQAEKRIKEVLKFSRGMHDTRWECIAFIVLSRIARFRKRPEEAREFADNACLLASSAPEDVQIRLDAYISRGESLVEDPHVTSEKIDEALHDFQNALKLAENNQKAYGVCHLHLADGYLRQNNVRKAWEHFQNWESIKGKIQHGLVHGIAAKIGQQIVEATQEWCFISGEQTLNYEHHDRKLREFLMGRAAARHKSVDGIADGLGIKRATYYNWLNEFRSRK
jgi:tetratricopeptide (TPR) repeat protein